MDESINFLQWFGYLASVVIATSLLMSSILKLRWINLAGASMFSFYGFAIGALPVGFMNLFIVFIDIYFLSKMYSKKEYFTVLEVKANNKYLLEFLKFYEQDIQSFFPSFTYKSDMNTLSFFLLRNMAVSGLFLAHQLDDKTLIIGLDYVIPEYRDLKPALYLYKKNTDYFTKRGYNRLAAEVQNSNHDKFLQKIGFKLERIEGRQFLTKEI